MKINGKEYKIPEIGFDAVCQLEETGFSLFDIQNPKKKFMTIIRAFVALATGLEPEDASHLIEQHLLGGGKMDGWMEEIVKAVETSGFFQAVMKKSQKKAPIHVAESEPTPTE